MGSTICGTLKGKAMKKLLAIFLLSTSANAADLEYTERYTSNLPPPQISYIGMIERRIRAYTDALIIETVQEKCVRYIKFDFPRDRLIPNKQYFIMGFDPPMQEVIIKEAKIRATTHSDEETYRKGLLPNQILTDSAWCRLVAPELMEDAKADLDRYLD